VPVHRAIALALITACGRIGFDQARIPGDGLGTAADAPPLTSGLVAYYPMDAITPVAPFSAQAQTLVDATPNHLDGTCNNFGCVAMVPGVIGGAYAFSSTGAFLVADAPALRLTSAFTVAAWLERANESSAFAKVQAAGAGASWELGLFAGATYFCTDHDLGPTGEDCMVTGVPVAATWQHVAMVFDGGQKTLYLDGAVIGTMTVAPPAYDASPMVVGADEENGTIKGYLSGAMDELRIYDRALSATEVAALRDLR